MALTAPHPFLGIGRIKASVPKDREVRDVPLVQLLAKLLVALRHNKRAFSMDHIDPGRTHLNYSPTGQCSPTEAIDLWQEIVGSRGGRIERRDAILAIELVCSLPPGIDIDHRRYFAECLAWAMERFGCPVLTADVHLDEGAPHMHVLLVPMQGVRLRGSDIIGGTSRFREHLTEFDKFVARPFGLERRERPDSRARGQMATDVIRRIQATRDPATLSPLWPILRKSIERDPAPFVDALGPDERPLSRRPEPRISARHHRETLVTRQPL